MGREEGKRCVAFTCEPVSREEDLLGNRKLAVGHAVCFEEVDVR
jgi:hypothetical protein